MTVSMVFARSLVAEFQRRGLNGEELLAASGISAVRLARGLPMLRYEEALRLASEAMSRSGDPGIGHDAGLATPATAFQMVSLLLLSQPSLRHAAKAFDGVSRLVFEGPRFSLIEDGDVATFAFRSVTPPHDAKRILYDFGVAFTARIGTVLTGLRGNDERDPALLRVHFQHGRPSYEQRYRDAYGCPILFDQPYNALVFRRELLERRSLHADTMIRSAADEYTRRMLRATERVRGWIERVRFVLDNTEDLSTLDGSVLAQRLGANERSLRRRLEREHTSWRSLLEEARCRRATQALRDRSVPIRDISSRLGFASVSAFSRAFREWTGQSPAAFRVGERGSPSGP